MRKYISIIAVLVLALCLSFVMAASGDAPVMPDGAGPRDGVYNIVNKATGEYLKAFNVSSTSGGYAYTDTKGGGEDENILVLKQDDGTYLLYPQSEAGKYAFYSNDNDRIAKSKDLRPESYFTVKGGDDGYVITESSGLALTGGGKKLYKKKLVMRDEYIAEDSQKWSFEAVEVTSLELKTVSSMHEVKVNSISAVYALTKPAYMKHAVQWSSSDESVVMIDTDGTFCALKAGIATVTATLGELSESIDISVVSEDAFTWYSQHLTSGGGWNASELSKVYFQSGGSYKRFIINGQNRGLDWMDQGCFLSSVATVLYNLGARYSGGYDFRYEAEGDLEIDPYVAALANSGNRGLTSSKGTLYNNPILVNYGRLKSSYTLHGQPVTFTQTYGVTKASLKAALDKHPEGVIVCLQNSYNGTHYVVVSKCINPDAAKSSNYRFMIYDPAGFKSSQGDNVTFERSISYEYMRYRYTSMRSMLVFNIVPTEEK